MPEDPDMKVMAVTKINVTRAPRALQFHIQELPNDHSKFHWGDFTDLTSDDMLAGPSKKNGAGNDLEDAKDFLVAELADGPLDVARLRRMGEKRSFSIKTLERAADALGVERFTTGFGKTKQAQWGMPPEKK